MAETETPVPVVETPAEEPKPTTEPETKIEEAAPADPPQPMEEDAPAAPAPAEEAAKPAPAQPAAEEPAPAPEEPKQLPVRQYLESTGVWSGYVVWSMLCGGMRVAGCKWGGLRLADRCGYLAQAWSTMQPQAT